MMTQTNGTQSKYLTPKTNFNSNQTDKIRISIIDDSRVIRECLKLMLETESDFDMVGTANDGEAGIRLVEEQKPDVVIMDIEMPKLNGISSTRIICERFSQSKVLVFSDHEESSYINQSLEAGAKGYFLKQTPAEEVIQGIRNVHRGFCQFSPGLLENYIRQTAQLSEPSENIHLFLEGEATSIAPVTSKTEAIETETETETETQLAKPTIFPQKPLLWRIAIWTVLAISAVAISALVLARFNPSLYSQFRNPAPPETPVPSPPPEPTAVSALGQIEPEGEIIQLSASAAAEGFKVEQLLVERGDRVRQGQVVAILDNHSSRLAALQSAKADVQTAQANLERVEAGAKQGDINAQKAEIARLSAELEGQIATQEATIARLSAELNNAQVENQRYQQLFQDGAISAQARDTRRLRVDTIQQQLSEAQETLNRTIATTQVQRNEALARLESITEVRPVDVQVAQAELAKANSAVDEAQAALALTEVRSPIDGQVLTVNVRPGEVMSNRGIVAIGQTDQMYVVAEVYETDIDRVRLGQKAIVTGSAFDEKLEGTIAQVGLEVKQQDVFESDPLVNTDNKVVEVKIRLSPESSKRVTALSNLQVQVVIAL
ncbi:MAG: response regulator [Pleurocapsa sp.]